MSNFLFFLSMFFLISCEKSSNVSTGIVIQEKKPSKVVKEIGVKEVEVPRIKISGVEDVELALRFQGEKRVHDYLSIREDFKDDSFKKVKLHDYLRRKILNLNFKKINKIEIDDRERVKKGDENIFIVSSWKDQDYFVFEDKMKSGFNYRDLKNYTGKFKVNFKVALDSLKTTKKIINIKVATLLYDRDKEGVKELSLKRLTKHSDQNEMFEIKNQKDFESERVYTLIDEEISAGFIYKGLVDRHELALKVSEFKFEDLVDKVRDYSSYIDKLQSENAKVVVSTSEKSRIFYVKPGERLEDFLKNNFKNVIFNEEGKLVAIDGVETNFNFPEVWSDIPLMAWDAGKWIVHGDYRLPLKEGKTYIVSYAIARELVESQRVQRKVLNNYKLEKEIKLNNVRPGDELTVKLSGSRFYPDYDVRQISLECGYEFPVGGLNERDRERERKIREYQFRWGQWCGVWHESFTGYKRKSIAFPEGFSEYRLKLVINDKEYELFNSLPSKNDVVTLNDGKVAKLRFVVKREMLQDINDVYLRVYRDPKRGYKTIGFVNWGNCAARNKRGFRFKHYSIKPQKHLNENLEKYNLNVWLRQL